MVGLTEEGARAQEVDYCVGRCLYKDTPRGLILGTQRGFLKLVVDSQSRAILGVHIFGLHATELIHYGMELVENGETVEHVLGTVFNFPTLHELYKYAAYDLWTSGLGK